MHLQGEPLQDADRDAEDELLIIHDEDLARVGSARG
jgi:hypothetical protein